MKPQSSIKLAIDNAPFQHRFLAVFGGIIFILIERSLAQWGTFFDSSPLLSFLIVGYFGLYFPALMPIYSVLILGLFCDLIALDPFGVRSCSMVIFHLLIRWQTEPLRDEDFGTIWAQISLILMLTSLVRLILYVGLNWSFPDLFSLGYQTGITALMFPIFFVAGSFISSLLQHNAGS